MRFLIDAQLPPALARYLEALDHQAEHIIELGLERAPDRLIWNAALERSAIIVTKDGDFAALRRIRGEGPRVIWIRVGNTTRVALLRELSKAWPVILAALSRGEDVIEVGKT